MKAPYPLISVLVLMGLLSGCAVLDVSSLETAIPLQPRRVEISTNQSIGIDLETVVLQDEDLNNGEMPPGYRPEANSVTGVQAAIGLQNDMEAGGRFWLSPFNYGGRIFLKKLLDKDANRYFAIQPAVTYLRSYDDDPGESYIYTAIGSELQLLYTLKASSNFAFTLVGRGNINRYQEQYTDQNGDEIVYGPYILFQGGLRGNIELRLHPFFFVPELGIEVVPVVNGETTLVPVIGFALGVEL